MKKIIFLFFLVSTTFTFAQNAGITYQAVIYNPNGEVLPGQNNPNLPLSNKEVCLRFTIIDAALSEEYTETQNTKTDEFGMVNLIIGKGNQTAGYASSFENILWNQTQKKIKVEIDKTAACANFIEISNQSFTSVPFAFASKTAENISGIVAIANGGTAANTVAAARYNLDLENVENTADSEKPVSSAQKAALDLKEDTTNKRSDVTLGNTSASDAFYPTQNAVKTYVDNHLSSASINDADAASKGILQLAGDLGGTAALPRVPELALKANISSLAAVASSGNYNDLTNKPTIPAAQIQTDWNATNGLGQILNKPSLSTVASTGSYNDLTNKPTISGTNTGDQDLSALATNTNLALKAPLDSPTFTGTATAPTALSGANTNQLATTAFVNDAVLGKFVDLTTTQTIAGTKTFSSDLNANGVSVGLGAGSIFSNTIVGMETFGSNTSGSYNVAIGLGTLGHNDIGNQNTAVGVDALTQNTSGNDNTALGLQVLAHNTIGYSNTGIGVNALNTNSEGNNNTAIGNNSLYNFGSNNNTAIGDHSLFNNIYGNNNTAIGYQSDVVSNYTTFENATAIGANAKITASNTIQLGDDGSSNSTTAITNVRTSGSITAGSITYPNTNGASGQVLTANTDGTASWTTPASGAISAIGTIAGTSDANGATITSGVLNLTPADASNGGILSNGTQTISGAKTFNSSITTPIYASTPQALTAGASINWNPANGLNASVTLDQNSSLSFSSTPIAGSYGTLVITQDATGGRTITLPSTTNKVLGSTSTTTIALSTAANAQDILNFYYDGNNCYWNIGQGYGAASSSSYSLPTASSSTIGGVKVGSNLSIDGSGVLSATINAANISGTVSISNGGTGATTAPTALANLTGTQGTNKVLAGPSSNRTTLTTYDGSSLTGWTNSGGTTIDGSTGNTGSSFKVTGSNQSFYRDLGQSLRNKTIEFDINLTSGVAGFSIGGEGFLGLKIATGTNSINGIVDQTSWLYPNNSNDSFTFIPGTWYAIKIVTDNGSVGGTKWYVNGNLIGNSGGYSMGNGTLFGILTDGATAYYDNIVIIDNSTVDATPTFRALVADDIPTLNQSTTGNAATATIATTAITASNVTGTVAIENGGTGATIQNFVDLSTNQNNIAGNKSFTNNLAVNGLNIGKGSGGASTILGDATSANDNSTAIGFMALSGNSGTSNTALGTNAMRNSSSTAYTTAVGVIAGQSDNTGDRNTFVGYAASVPNGSAISNATAIGAGAVVLASNTIQMGSNGSNGFTAITNVNTSGTLTAGAVTYPNTDGVSGQVLSTNGSGTLGWTTPITTLTTTGTGAASLSGTILNIPTPTSSGSTTYTIGLNNDLGGYVVYLTPDGKHGLVAETIDQVRNTGEIFRLSYKATDPENHSTEGKNFMDWRIPNYWEMLKVMQYKSEIGGFDTVNWSNYFLSISINRNETDWILDINSGQDFTGMANNGANVAIRTVRSF